MCDSGACHRTGQEGTKFNDLNGNGKRDSGEPGLAGWRIWADYDDDGVRDTGEPYDDTDASGNYKIAGIDPPTTAYRLREQRPGGGNGGWKCSYPNASTSGGFASGKGGDFGCGWGPINPCRSATPRTRTSATTKRAEDHRDQEARPRLATAGASTSRSTARWSRRRPATAGAGAPSSARARTT